MSAADYRSTSIHGTQDHKNNGATCVAVSIDAKCTTSAASVSRKGGPQERNGLFLTSASTSSTGRTESHSRQHGQTRNILVTSAYISFWLLNSIALILFNQSLLSSTFPYPATLTCAHMLVASVFCRTVSWLRGSPQRSFDARIVFVAVLFTISLVLRNSAYKFVSVAVIQMVSAFSPLAVYVATCALGLETLRSQYLACILVVSAGICISSYGFVAVRWIGVVLQTVGIGVEAFRTALLQLLLQQQRTTQEHEAQSQQDEQKKQLEQTPKQEHQQQQQQQHQPQQQRQQTSVGATKSYDNITLMSHMAPISAAILLPMGIYEVGPTRVFLVLRDNATSVLANSLFALGMNLASLLVIQVSSSLTISLASILRDWALVCISYTFFGAHISGLSAVGWCITTAGLMSYTALKNNTVSSRKTDGTTKKKKDYTLLDRDINAHSKNPL